MNEIEYDVVIVGAGITGALVAKTLVEKGRDKIQKVLILEAGKNSDKGATAAGYREYVNNYYEASAKVPNSPYPTNEDAPTANVLDIKKIPPEPITKGYLVQYGPVPFLSDFTRTPGVCGPH